MNPKFPRDWEFIDGNGMPTDWIRLKVYGGWIVSRNQRMIFISDMNHEWILEDEIRS